MSDGAGEGAALVAEKFTFEQAAGDGGAVELDERAVLAAAAIVNGARDEFFAGAGLAEQKHRRIAVGTVSTSCSTCRRAELWPTIPSKPDLLAQSARPGN